MKLFLKLLRNTLILIVGLWGALILCFSPVLPNPWNTLLATMLGIVSMLLLFQTRVRTLMWGAFVLLITATITLWHSIMPSNTREWMPDVALAPSASFAGDTVTVYNVRNFEYRSESDFIPRYDTRLIDLSKLTEVDIIVSYWAGETIAHIMTSFGFSDGQFLTFSIETRRENSESYSPVKGFFRNYELVYIVADERDVLGLRARYRSPQERVFILRTAITPDFGRKLLRGYLEEINSLDAQPSFYNTLTTNCTTQVLWTAQAFGSDAPYNWKILLSGYVPQYLYENQGLTPRMSLEEIMSASYVSQTIRDTPLDNNFSTAIRALIPKP
jgi:hypothetical protein